jgi:hypothetical protein
MKKIFCFLIVVILMHGVFALGVSPAILRYTFNTSVHDTVDLTVMGGDITTLAKYVAGDDEQFRSAITLGELKASGGDIILPVTIDFRKIDITNITPGTHRMLVGVKETAAEGQFAALVAIQVPVYIFVPFEGILFDARVSIADVKLGEPGKAIAIVKNLGKVPITLLPLFIISETGGEEKIRIPIAEVQLASGEQQEISRTFSSDDLKSGSYTLKFTAQINNMTLTKEAQFRVGNIDLEIISVKQKYAVNKVEQFVMKISNKWNEEVKDAFAEVTISNNTKVASFKTSFFDVPASSFNQSAEVKQYFDTSGIAPGKYTMNVTAFFGNSAVSQGYDVEFVKGAGNMIYIVGAIVLVVVAGVIFLLIRKKNKKSRR